MLKTIDRLIQFIKYVGMSARQFDLSIGAANGYTLRMQKNNASIGSDVLENILKVYPQLNVVWLLTGVGEMLKEVEEGMNLDFDKLSKEKQNEIEALIERKINERKEEEIKRLIKVVTMEIEKTKTKLKDE